MNSFLDLSAIKHTVSFRAVLRPIYQSRPPNVGIILNDEPLFSGNLQDTYIIQTSLPLLNSIRFEVGLLDKVYDQHDETAVIIDQLDIEDFSFIPNYTHWCEYTNDHDFNSPTNYLGFVGVWRLMINEPFYRWRHRVTDQGWLLEP